VGDSQAERLASILNVSVENAPKDAEEIQQRLRAGDARAETPREEKPVSEPKPEAKARPGLGLPDLSDLVGVEPEDPLVAEEALRRAEELRERMLQVNQELAKTVLKSASAGGHIRVATDGFGRLLSLDIDREAVRQPRGLGYALVEAINSAQHDGREMARARRSEVQKEVAGEA
jgi:DNA-binding protein YbaB